MENKQEILSRLYSLRAGISVVSQQSDKIDEIKAQKSSKQKERDKLVKSLSNDIDGLSNVINNSETIIAGYNNRIEDYQADIETAQKRKSTLSKLIAEENQETSLSSINSGKAELYASKVKLYTFLEIGAIILTIVLPILTYIFLGPIWSDGEWQFSPERDFSSITRPLAWFIAFLLLSAVTIVGFCGGLVLLILCLSRVKKYSDERRRIIKEALNTKKNALADKIRKENIIQDKGRIAPQRIKDLEEKIEQQHVLIENTQNHIDDLEQEIKETADSYKNELATLNDDLKVEEYTASVIYDALKKEYGDYVNVSDWEDLDFLIYYIETGRASDIKEALQLTDRQKQLGDLKNAMQTATNQISRSISSGLQELQGNMVKCFSVVSNQINALNEQQIKTNAFLEKINVETSKANTRLQNIEILTENK